MSNVSLFNEYSAEDQAIARRRKMAEMLQQQSMTPLESSSANGWVIPTSPIAGLAKLLQGYSAGKMTSAADEQQKALGQRFQTEGTSALAKGLREWRGTPERPAMLDPQELEQQADQGTVAPPNIPAQAPDQNAAMATFGSHPMTQPYSSAIMAQLLKGEDSKFSKVDPKDFTPESVTKFASTGKHADLVPRDKLYFADTGSTIQGLNPYTGQPNAGATVPKSDDFNQPFSRSGGANLPFQQYSKELKVLGAPRTQVSVDNRALGKYADVVGGKSGEDDITQFGVAQASVENAEKLDKTLSILRKSNAITGMGADILKNVERAKVLFANDKKAGKKVSDTEYLNALLGSDVFPMIKELGIGARGLDTPAEREFLREVMSGTVNMNKDTLIRMTQIRRDIAQRSMDRWNKRVKSGELDDFFKYANRPKSTVDYQPSESAVPTTAPSGVRVVDW